MSETRHTFHMHNDKNKHTRNKNTASIVKTALH